MTRFAMVTLARIEAQHLADLVRQFLDLLAHSHPSDDDAIARLVPDAYEDEDAAREFRRTTEGDILGRRSSDAQRVLESLRLVEDGHDERPLDEPVDIPLDDEGVQAWMRTLAALRLVIASRLDIDSEDRHDPEDPRFAVYDWLGYRLDGLITGTDEV